MNKTECLDLLENVLKNIENHNWEAQVEDSSFLLDHEDLKGYLADFDLPEAKMNKNVCVGLPKDWLPNVSIESEDYAEVLEKYEDVYHFLRTEASREVEALNYMDECDEKDMNNQFFSDCGVY
jgi:hypothetical protein